MIKVIACKIYEYYILQLKYNFTNYEFIYLDIQQHNYPRTLAKQIQKEIDKGKNYEKIIILYGLCGNALLEIKARNIPVYIIKVHDCLSVLLGSKRRFNQLFKERLSVSWSCYSLKVNNCDFHNDQQYLKWCQQYGQETANYLKDSLMKENNIYLTYNYKDDQEFIENKELIKIDLKFLKDILLFKSTEVVRLYKNTRIISSEEINEVFKIKEDYKDE